MRVLPFSEKTVKHIPTKAENITRIISNWYMAWNVIYIWKILIVCSVPLLFKGMEGPITAKIRAVVCGGLERDWMNKQRWTGEHLRKWGDYSVWAFKGNLLVAFKLMLTLAVQLSWACARRSFSDEEKVPTLSFSDRSRSVHLSRCDTNLTNRDDRKSDTLRPIWESSN